jgi:hypothetical protein
VLYQPRSHADVVQPLVLCLTPRRGKLLEPRLGREEDEETLVGPELGKGAVRLISIVPGLPASGFVWVVFIDCLLFLDTGS